MDFLLPSEETMSLMSAEYDKALSGRGDRAAALSAPYAPAEVPAPSGEGALPRACASPCALFVLYFAFVLGYNLGYGNATADANGNVGGVQSRQGRNGDFYNFRPRKG